MEANRPAESETTEGLASPLPTWIIAVICGVCGLALFGALTFLVICLSRKKHRARQLAAQRNLDLADDDSIHNALYAAIATAPHPLEKTASANPFLNDSDPNLQGWYEKTNGKVGEKGENGEIIPPAYAFHITGSRDSWPLVSWSTTPKVGVLPDPPAATLRPIQPSSQLNSASTAYAKSTIAPGTALSSNGVQRQNPTGHGLGAKPSVSIKQPQMFTFGPHPSTTIQQPQPYPYSYPQPLVIRPSPQHGAPPPGARHARGKSANSVPRYRTEADSQLITVLKSTSQRLREAQAQAQAVAQAQGVVPNSTPDHKRQRTSVYGAVGDARPSTSRMSILSPLDGDAPKERPQTPQKKTHIAQLSKELVASPEKETESVCDSSHTSVLDMFLTTDKVVLTPRKQTATENERRSIFDSENRIDLDGAATPTPVNSPTNATNEHGSKRSPGGTPVTVRKLHHDSMTMHQLSSITRGAKPTSNHQRNQSSSGDPFVIKGSPAAMHVTNMSPSNPSTISAIRPLHLSRSNTHKKSDQTFTPVIGSKQALRSSSPPKMSSSCANAPPHPNPPVQMDFTWPVAQLPVLPPPSSRQNKGHKRSKTVRLSTHQLIRSSICIVPEEKEENTSPKDSLMVPSNLSRQTSRASNLSYSATMDLFDMYSSPNASRSPSRSPTRSPERYRRLSVSSGGSNNSNLENQAPSSPNRAASIRNHPQLSAAGASFQFPSIKADERKALSELKLHIHPSNPNLAQLSRSNTLTRAQASPSKVNGPREARESILPVCRNSVQASIGLLRRMNSVMSVSSILSTSSNGETPRASWYGVSAGSGDVSAKDISPTRQDTMKRGQNNYLGLGQRQHRSPSHKRVAELATQFEAGNSSPSPPTSPKRMVSVSVQVSSPTPTKPQEVVSDEAVAGDISPLGMPLGRVRGVLGKKGFETDKFGNPVGSNALGIIPILEPGEVGWEYENEGGELKGTKGVKSSPTLGRGGGSLREKDSGVDMREGNEKEKEGEEEKRDSIYDAQGFLKSSPARK